MWYNVLMENNATIIGTPQAGIFDEPTLKKFKNYKNILQKFMIWALVGGAICGALFILIGGIDGGEVVGKFMGTLFILGGAALVSFINFNKIETKISSVQVFAIIGVVTNVLWMTLWILALWGVFDIWARGACITYRYSSTEYCPVIGYSVFGIFTMIVSYLSSLGFLGALTLGIYEGTKKSTIRPLKLTAISCLCYVEFHAITRIFTEFSSSSSSSSSSLAGRFDVLAAFAGFVWFITALVAVILAKHEKNAAEYEEKKKKDEEQQKILAQAAANVASAAAPSAPKTDEELRAEIEEKVRREMIEKEVREKLEKEMAEKSTDSTSNPSAQ